MEALLTRVRPIGFNLDFTTSDVYEVRTAMLLPKAKAEVGTVDVRAQLD